ncbi:MAG: TSUP family transporter [Clostridia bacterium]|nr:TSUP family transporter [Clostridia bacterium]
MEITFQMYLIVLPMVFLAALVDSIAGGGGLISLPAYTLVGLDYNLASGCNKFSAMFGTLVATIRYYKSGKLLLVPGLCAAATALPGSWLGTRIAMALGTDIMNGFMVFAIPVVGVLVLFRGKKDDSERPPMKHMKLMCLVIGFVIGMYDGFFGPGTGTFLIILFTWITGMSMVSATATAKPVNLASNIASLITRIAAGDVLYALAIPAMCCSIAGGWIGSRLALKRGAKLIRFVMMGVLLLLTIKLAVDMIA